MKKEIANEFKFKKKSYFGVFVVDGKKIDAACGRTLTRFINKALMFL